MILYVQSQMPDDGQRECPKHRMLFQNKINLRYRVSGWFYYRIYYDARSYKHKKKNGRRLWGLKIHCLYIPIVYISPLFIYPHCLYIPIVYISLLFIYPHCFLSDVMTRIVYIVSCTLHTLEVSVSREFGH